MGCYFEDINFNIQNNQYIAIRKNPEYGNNSNYPFIAHIVTINQNNATAEEIQGS